MRGKEEDGEGAGEVVDRKWTTAILVKTSDVVDNDV